MMKTTLTAVALLLPVAGFAQSAPATAPETAAAAPASAPISITEGFARSTNPKSGGVYMVFTNDGATACTLAGIETAVAEKAELHTMRDENGVMRMMAADPLTLAPATSHKLQRGGDHVMLMGIHQPLEQGQMIPFTFDFGDCGTVNTEVRVDNESGAKAGAAAGHGSHGGAQGGAHDGHGDAAPEGEHAAH